MYRFDSDLFTTSQPIINDVCFFGRRDYALDVATKCKNSSYLYCSVPVVVMFDEIEEL